MRRMGPITLVLVTAIGGLAGLAACSSGGKPDVTVTEREFKVSPSTDNLTAGKVRIKVVNAGTAAHELVAFRTDLDEGALPLTAKGDRIDEEGTGITHLDPEAEDVAPGKSKTITIELAKGRYVFVCNLAGHYQSGMHAVLTVS